MNRYRLLVLDGHNSHCTYEFCKFAADHKIIVACLPAHTTHALQPCDVGIFNLLSTAWKAIVNEVARSHSQITKDSFLHFYSRARREAMKPGTVCAAFAKCGLWPLNANVLSEHVFEPSKNTSTAGDQPLKPPNLGSLLIPILASVETMFDDGLLFPPDYVDELIPPLSTMASPLTQGAVQHLLVGLPPSLPFSAPRDALCKQNGQYRDIAIACMNQVQRNHAQIVLMDLEIKKLRKTLFSKQNKKSWKETTSHPWHMTGEESLDTLARVEWEDKIKKMFKTTANIFRERHKRYDDLAEAEITATKAQEQAAKKAQHAAQVQERRSIAAAAKEAQKVARAAAAAKRQASKAKNHPPPPSIMLSNASDTGPHPRPRPRPLSCLQASPDPSHDLHPHETDPPTLGPSLEQSAPSSSDAGFSNEVNATTSTISAAMQPLRRSSRVPQAKKNIL